MKISYLRCIPLLAFVASLLFSMPAQAKQLGLLPDPFQVTIFDQFSLYQQPSTNSTSDGALSAIQTFTVKGYDKDTVGWYLAETWLGDRWINLSQNQPFRYGPIVKEDKTITLLTENELFDTPFLGLNATAKVAAQKVHVTGKLPFCQSGVNYDCQLSWLRIDTWLGEKWIAPSEYPELIEESALNSDFQMKFESPLYVLPFFSQKIDKVLPAGTSVHLKGVYSYVPGRAGPMTWYRIETKDGDRWIVDPYNTLRGAKAVDEKLKLESTFHYYKEPNTQTKESELNEPQTLTVFEKIGDYWYHVRTSSGDKWASPKEN